MEAFLKFIDPYDRQARLYPGLLVILPLPVLLVCLYGTSNILASSVLSILAFSGVAYVLGRIARDAGKRKQEKLFAKWGGSPTTQLLRHNNQHFDVHTKERYHLALSTGLGKTIPSASEEQADVNGADDVYRSATVWLIGRTRDTVAFPLVFKENIAFGFQRNAFGLRWLGITLSVVCLIWAMINAGVLVMGSPYIVAERVSDITPATMVTLSISVLMIILWTLLINESAVKRTAFAYAERLIQSCDQL